MPIDPDAVRAVVRESAAPGEDVDETVAGIEALAEERARRLGREPTPEDGTYFLSMFCWNPLKPDPPKRVQDDLRRIRSELFAPGSDALAGRPLTAAVREDALAWTPEELYDAQQAGVDRFLTLGTGEAPA